MQYYNNAVNRIPIWMKSRITSETTEIRHYYVPITAIVIIRPRENIRRIAVILFDDFARPLPNVLWLYEINR